MVKANIKTSLEGKETVTPSSEAIVSFNSVLPTEKLIEKGIKGKLKLAFNFLDTRVNNTISNLDKVVVSFHDKSKRKIF
jgi:hypothetical protein